jgi:hypothetical protein
LSWIENQIVPDRKYNKTTLAVFASMMVLVLSITAFMIYFTLYRKRKQKEYEALVEAKV